jgi:hypothetical protein
MASNEHAPEMQLLLNGEQIVEQVQYMEDFLEVPRRSLVVLGGAALAVMGIKETHDIDISANVHVMRKVHSRLATEQRIGACGTVLETTGPWEIANGWGTWPHAYVRQNSRPVHGVSVMKAAYVLRWKGEHGRDKDGIDLQSIVRYTQRLESGGGHRMFMALHGFNETENIEHDCPASRERRTAWEVGAAKNFRI